MTERARSIIRMLRDSSTVVVGYSVFHDAHGHSRETSSWYSAGIHADVEECVVSEAKWSGETASSGNCRAKEASTTKTMSFLVHWVCPILRMFYN